MTNFEAFTDDGVVVGADGRARCWWGAEPPVYAAYHDDEWGRVVHDEHALFEKLCLECFQSGLSWLTILKKREAFRAAFAGFAIDAVAAFGDADVARLLRDASIVRHEGKIRAVIANARAAQALHAAGSSLDEVVWGFAPAADRPAPRGMSDLLATTPESKALAADLKGRGFRFVGPSNAHAFMQAMGLVNDHLQGCDARPSGR